jgi:hypothetical protein
VTKNDPRGAPVDSVRISFVTPEIEVIRRVLDMVYPLFRG